MGMFLKGQYRLFQNIDKLSQAARDVVRDAITDTATAIRDTASSTAPRFSGGLASSMDFFFPYRDALTAQIRGVADHAIAQEMGYLGIARHEFTGNFSKTTGFPLHKRIGGGRGNTGHKWPWSPELVQWARAKGLNPVAVSRAIGKRGYAAQPFLFKSMESHGAEFLRRVEAAIAADNLAKAAGIPQGPVTPAGVGA